MEMKNVANMAVRTLLVCAVVSSGLLLSPSLSGATVRVCSHSGLAEALSKGGTIRFGCAGPIGITNVLVVSRDAVLDASDHTVRLLNVEWSRIFQINPGVSLTLINLTVD